MNTQIIHSLITRWFATKLRRDLTFTLFFKLILLLALWWLCFADPVQNHLTLLQIKQHWIGT